MCVCMCVWHVQWNFSSHQGSNAKMGPLHITNLLTTGELKLRIRITEVIKSPSGKVCVREDGHCINIFYCNLVYNCIFITWTGLQFLHIHTGLFILDFRIFYLKTIVSSRNHLLPQESFVFRSEACQVMPCFRPRLLSFLLLYKQNPPREGKWSSGEGPCEKSWWASYPGLCQQISPSVKKEKYWQWLQCVQSVTTKSAMNEFHLQ